MLGRIALARSPYEVGRTVKAGMIVALVLGCLAPARGADEILVANYSSDDVAAFPRAASGDVAPVRTIAEGLQRPHTVAIDPVAGEMFVSNNLYASQEPAIDVYDVAAGLPGSETPKRRIAGPLTGLNRPAGLAVDPVHRELYVANDLDSGSSIVVFPLGANGNVPPLRTLRGPATGIEGPIGMAVDFVHDELLVANYKVSEGGSIVVFPRTASGNFPPLRTIQGPQTRFDQPQGLALDLLHDEIVVANSSFLSGAPGSILVFPRTAVGDVAPIRSIGGPATGLCNPIGIALDLAHDEILTANSHFSSFPCESSVTVYERAANGDAPWVRRVGPGPLSALDHPTSVVPGASSPCPPPSVRDGRACVLIRRIHGRPVAR